MAMRQPDGFQDVFTKPDFDADSFPVTSAFNVDVLAEVPPPAGAAAEAATKWLKVRAFSPDGVTILEGFMSADTLRPIPELINRATFARACLAAAREYGANAQYLFAFADLVSGIRNLAPKGSTACGPFQIREEMWNAEVAADESLDLEPFDRERPYLQPWVAARIAAQAAGADINITLNQLCIVQLFGLQRAKKLLDHPPTTSFDAALVAAYADHPTGAQVAAALLSEDPAALYKDPVTAAFRTIGGVMGEIDTKLAPLLATAEKALRAVDADAFAPDVPGPGPGGGGGLKLGVNEIFREPLLFAANRTGFAAPALAALIDAEADKKNSGQWNPTSDARPLSSAFGLTQFLDATWEIEAKKATTFLNQEAKAKGFVNASNAVVERASLLEMRAIPVMSITAAAEFAVANLAQLAGSDITPERLMTSGSPFKGPDVDSTKARLAYLAHHEGAAGASAVVRGSLSEARAETLLRVNQKKTADQRRAKAGSWVKAYTDWLVEYIDSHIVPAKFTGPAGSTGGAGPLADPPVTPAAGFAAKIRDKAIDEWKFFGSQTKTLAGNTDRPGHKEDEARKPPGSGEDYFAHIGTYWRIVGDNKSDGRTDKPWSAAFISFVMKSCGAADRFNYSGQHSVYISRAIADRGPPSKDAAGYWCFRLTEKKPKVGDLVCWAREGGIDYDHQRGGDYAGHCDIIVDVLPDRVQVIGGNVGNSVTKRPVPLDNNGFLRPISRPGERLFAIMTNRLP